MPVRLAAASAGIRFGTAGKPAGAFTLTFLQQVATPNDSTSRTIFFAERDASPYATIRLTTSGANLNELTGFEGSAASLSPPPNEADWYMWALVSNGTGAGSVKAYAWKVGDSDGTYSQATSTNSTTGVLGSALWGLGAYGTEYRNARYCFAKIWDAALTLSELQLERRQGKPVRTANLNRYHRLATNTDTSDGSGNGRVLSFTGTVNTEGAEPIPWELTGKAAVYLALRRMMQR